MSYDVKVNKQFLQQILEEIKFMPSKTDVYFSTETLMDGTGITTATCENEDIGLLVTFNFKEYEQTTRIS